MVQGLGVRFWVSGLVFRVCGLGFRIYGLRLRISDLVWSMVKCLGFRA